MSDEFYRDKTSLETPFFSLLTVSEKLMMQISMTTVSTSLVPVSTPFSVGDWSNTGQRLIFSRQAVTVDRVGTGSFYGPADW